MGLMHRESFPANSVFLHNRKSFFPLESFAIYGKWSFMSLGTKFGGININNDWMVNNYSSFVTFTCG